MNLNGTKRSLAVILLLLSPYFLGFSPRPDSSWTEIRFALGKGSYAEVRRDCEGKVVSVTDVPFEEAGVAVDHYFSVLHLGLKGGAMSEAPANEIFNLRQNIIYYPFDLSSINPRGRFYYAAPTIGLNMTYFGFDAGYVFPAEKKFIGFPSGSMRIGSNEAFHFRLRMADDLPLVTGGPGLVNLGFGFNLGKPRHLMWLGMGTLPYEGLMFGANVDLPLSEQIGLSLRGSLGGSESTQGGFSATAKVIL